MRRNRSANRNSAIGHESDFHRLAKGAETLGFDAIRLGQRKPYSCPEHCPHPEGGGSWPLGVPLSIEDVAELLGCSTWTIRQKYVPGGLPHLRASHSGKLVFFRTQVLNWILERQTKGGNLGK
jgi:hypothetical protein